ncbi:MAG TPA: RDD family protein [Blastocatellia bacterium]|nr:RDD family protein [Blastocatellia bacterium]
MKCPVCSHVYPDTLSRCSRCGRVAPDQPAQPTAGSTLIEFPSSRQVRSSLPDWRLELNEKVRAIKARRSMEALVGEATMLREVEPLPDMEQQAPPEPDPDDHENPIVRAALNRVRRASENAARVAHQSSSRTAAAARMPAVPASEPMPEPAPRIVPVPDLPPPPPARRTFLEPRPSQPSLLFDPAELLEGFYDDLNPLKATEQPGVAAAAEPVRSGPPHGRRLVAGLADAAILLVVSIPFAAIAYATEADFRKPGVIVLLAIAFTALALFYLFSTVGVSGRTVGMMLRRLHIETADGERPGVVRIALRAIGYLVCVATAGLGFAWILVSGSRRGLHDLISGTRVVED